MHEALSVFGAHVAVKNAFGVHDHGRARAFFAIFAEVEAVAGLHAVVGFLAAGHEGLEALQLQLLFEGLGQVVADIRLLIIANE